MIRSLAVAAALALSAAPALAASVTPCGDGPRADTIAEPWEASTATYAEGKVRVTLIDTVEPAGAPFHLMIQAPPLDELGLRGCSLVSVSPGNGFYSLGFAARTASHDADRGLILRMPASTMGASGEAMPLVLEVAINQSTGVITATTGP